MGRGGSQQAEDHQEARLARAQQAPEYAQSRQDCLQLAARLADRCGVSEEAVYTSMVLLDYAVWAGIPYTLVSHPRTLGFFDLACCFRLQRSAPTLVGQ